MALDTTTQTASPATSDILGRLLYGLAVLTLALTPTQMTFTVKHLELTPAELVLIAAAVVWVIRWLQVRDTHSLPPLTNWLIIGVAVLGLFSLLAITHSAGHHAALTHIKKPRSNSR